LHRDNIPFGMCQGDCDTDDDCEVSILFDVSVICPYWWCFTNGFLR
jgi:hypothetical protein